jgi:hypothetical protein
MRPPIQELHNFDPHMWFYDKANGKMLAEIALPSNATGAPVTYMVGSSTSHSLWAAALSLKS